MKIEEYVLKLSGLLEKYRVLKVITLMGDDFSEVASNSTPDKELLQELVNLFQEYKNETKYYCNTCHEINRLEEENIF